MSQNDSRIFKATYSGVPVYEMLCKGVAVMRRQSDSYLNATQILKVADFDKPQRTRILEREVQVGKHEKVQGGYGKYQGTWVPFDRGVALAQQYNVDTILQPIIDFVKGDQSPPMAPKHVTAASHRPRKPRETTRRKRTRHVHHHDELEASEDEVSSQYSEIHDNDSILTAANTSANAVRTPSPLVGRDGTPDQYILPPPRRPYNKRKAAYPSEEDEDVEMEDDNHTYAQKLLHHFVSGSNTIPPILTHPPRDLEVNVIIDDEGHTSLHWAAAMGQIQTVKVLIHLRADVYRVNYKGQTALMRSVLFTNNFDRKSFHHLLDMLQKTIFNIDKKDQTVFHHVASTASWKGKVHASRYYMECLIDKLSQNRSELISILNVQDVYGDTALTIAARIGNKKLVRLLTDAGASTEIANEEGMTAQDYLSEVERRMLLQDNLAAAATSSPNLAVNSVNEQAARARLRQKFESMFKMILSNDRSVPAISQLFDGFAGSYERDLTQKEQAVKEKKVDLELTHKRLAETRRILDQVRFDPSLLDEAEDAAQNLETRLRKLMQYSQKEKLARLVHDHEEKESSHHESDTEPEALENTIQELEAELISLQKTRKDTVEELVRLKAQTPGKRYQDYKRLISMCCNVAYENVDMMLSPLLASFNERDTT
ncbi:apses-domain-containing protein [Lichtheimia hyalospora FSU 10163]|nr:apses-domain-containing protein [Lichtheimia hyalospora FSU 10163]